LAIGNVPEWLTDPGCSLFLQGSNSRKVQGWPNRLFERLCQRVLLATFQIRFSGWLFLPRTLPFTSTHLAPSCCEPGRVSHSVIANFRLPIVD